MARFPDQRHRLERLMDSVMQSITDPHLASVCCDAISIAYTTGYTDCQAKKKPVNGLFLLAPNDARRQVKPEDITAELRRIGQLVKYPLKKPD